MEAILREMMVKRTSITIEASETVKDRSKIGEIAERVGIEGMRRCN